MKHEVKPEDLADLMLAGNALLTFQSRKTENHFTFKFVKFKDLFGIHWKKQLIGHIVPDLTFHIYPKAETMTKEQESIAWIWKYILSPDTLAKNLIIYHHGICCRCGRILSTPKSIQAGLGPECSKRTVSK